MMPPFPLSPAAIAADAAEGLSPWQTWFRSICAAPWFPPVVLCLLVGLLACVGALLVLARRNALALRRLREPAAPIVSVAVGKVHGQGARDYQQDSFGISDPSRLQSHGILAVVADGMGGLQHGDKISAAVVETILDGFLYSQGQGTPEQALLTLTQWAVQKVNGILGPGQYRSSGSTLAMGLIKDNVFSFVNIGDSRICLCRNGCLIQLTREHDFKQTLALQAVNGEIPLQDVYTDKRKDGLVSFLGMGPLEQLDLPAGPLALRPGDQLLLMSDGVYNALSDQELLKALGAGSNAPQALEAAILQKGYQNQDNYTAVILACEGGQSPRPRNPNRREAH